MSGSTKERKKRNTGSETFTFLEKKIEQDQELRRGELARKKEDEEMRRQEERQRERRLELLQEQ